MSNFLAPCGMRCHACEAYLATQANDAAAIAAIATSWSQRYRMTFSPEDIWCDGCDSSSARTNHHCRDCPIRPCARNRNLPTCAECPDYRCENVTRLHQLAPEAQQNLEK